ncbi:short-chain collagen C4-like [Crassostrea angulata]|uniref:short-chain collagen C4-like n=1 Tax=Magallana angulata TaxID=2784310 RepID=UPI0022B1BE79|nr:short-chain collagen C4-like [Crassostrea angulata]
MFPTAFVTIFMTVLLLASSQPALGTHRSLLDRIRDEHPRWISGYTGSTYIIWGKHSCPAVHGTKEVYNGYVGGSQYNEKGNGANTLCLPHDPDRLPYGISLPARNDYAHLFGGEYQLNIHHVRISENVPCAVCRTNIASSTIMIPAKRTCPTQWRKQYTGILTANRYDYRMTEYLCLDDNPDYVHGSRKDDNGRIFYPVKTVCGSLPCPPYENGELVSCIVCSR